MTPSPNIEATPEQQALAQLAGLNFANPLFFNSGVFASFYTCTQRINPSYCPTDILSALLAIIFADLAPTLIDGPPLWSTYPIVGAVVNGLVSLNPSFFGSFNNNVAWW